MSLEEKRNKLNEQLEALKLFPDNNQIRILRSRINRQLESIEERERLEAIEVIPTTEELKELSNIVRGKKLSRHHRFIRMIKDTYFPDMKYREIQKELKKRKLGQKSEIAEAVWENPIAILFIVTALFHRTSRLEF